MGIGGQFLAIKERKLEDLDSLAPPASIRIQMVLVLSFLLVRDRFINLWWHWLLCDCRESIGLLCTHSDCRDDLLDRIECCGATSIRLLVMGFIQVV